MSLDILELLLGELEAGRPAVLVSLRAWRGSVPRKDFPRALFLLSGEQRGTVGGGCLDGFARDLALRALAADAGTVIRGEQSLHDEEAEASGLICGGHVELEAEAFPPTEAERVRAMMADPTLRPPRLLVIGGGHVGLAAARFADSVGWRVAVLDDRERYANPERFPFAEACLVGEMDKAEAWLPAAGADAVLIATRGHQRDYETLAWAARTAAGFIGLLGSRRKRSKLLARLAEDGIDGEALAGRFHSPVGLAIGAQSAEEIGLAAVAQIVAWRRGTLTQP